MGAGESPADYSDWHNNANTGDRFLCEEKGRWGAGTAQRGEEERNRAIAKYHLHSSGHHCVYGHGRHGQPDGHAGSIHNMDDGHHSGASGSSGVFQKEV